MTRDQALAILKRSEPELVRRGVRRAAIFGSTARNEATAESDVDVMVELDPTYPMGVWEYAGLASFIGEQFPVRVDVANRETLRRFIRPNAERDAVYAF